MKNKAIILSLIMIMVGIIALGIGWHKIFDASATKPNLIECKGHIDKNQDMSCDICGAILSGESDTKYKIVKNTLESGTTIEVKGDMPSNAVLTTKEITKEVATNIAKRYIPIEEDKILYAYDISMISKDKKYQPENYGKNVDITLSNLKIEDKKDIVVMHILDAENYEIMKLDELSKSKVSFKTTSFSTYIVLKVPTYNVTFTGLGDFEVQTLRGNKITNNTELISGTNFSFVVTPKEGYGISEITTSNGTIITNGDILRKTATIDNITQDTTITVTTIAAPKITKQITTAKVASGENATFKVTAQNVTTYEWQYRADEDDYWKSASKIGTANADTLTISNVTDAINGYNVRCVLSNTDFDNGYEIKSDIAFVILAEGTLQMPVAIDEPIKEESKMITEWTIPADNTTIKLPVAGTGLNVTVDWGDGSAEQTVTTSFPTHTYATAGTYEIKVWGTCPKWGYAGVTSVTTTQNSDYYTYTQYLTKVKQFGELGAQQYGFAQCKNLTEVSGDNLVTNRTFEKTTSMAYMFYYCTNLTSLDVSSFDTSNVTDMSGMFDNCKSLTSLDVSNLDTQNVKNMCGMFGGCTNLTSLDVSNFDTSNVSNMAAIFSACSSLKSLNVSNFDTSNVTNMEGMFNECRNLIDLDVSKFNTAKVTVMSAMFSSCSSLKSLNVSKFNTSNVTTMSIMFNGCSALKNLDLSTFNTSNVTDMSHMFNSCRNLTSLNISNIDTSNVKYMYNMFWGCSSLTSLDVSNFDTSKVTSMKYMLYECSGLTNLNLSNFDTSKVTDMGGMFYRCSNLKSLQLSNKFVIPASNNTNMFTDTTNLTSIILVDSTPLAGQFTNIKAQLDGKTFYVPSKSAETAYETSWATDFSGDRIEPILELIGDENITIDIGATYTDAGYTVAGLTTADEKYYTPYGYKITKNGEVVTNTVGVYKIKYEITRTYMSGGTSKTDTLMDVTRIITVEEKLIIVDVIPPKGSITVKDAIIRNNINYVPSSNVTLEISAQDNISTSSEIKVYITTEAIDLTKTIADALWENYSNGMTKSITITNLSATTRIYALFKDAAGNTSAAFTGADTEYSIIYNLNGGTGSIENGTANYGSPAILSNKVPTKSGMYFLGWSTNASATVASYKAGGVMQADTFSGTNKNINLYAVWGNKPLISEVVEIGDLIDLPIYYNDLSGNNRTDWKVISKVENSTTGRSSVVVISTGIPLTLANTSADLVNDFFNMNNYSENGFENNIELSELFLNKYVDVSDEKPNVKGTKNGNNVYVLITLKDLTLTAGKNAYDKWSAEKQ